jgi:hypothetical protein
MAYVDMRYSNGFAVGWNPGAGNLTKGLASKTNAKGATPDA